MIEDSPGVSTGAAPGTYKIDIWVNQRGSGTLHESVTLIKYTVS